MVPAFPARKALYNMATLQDPKEALFTLYPETPLCRNCNACTEACPQGIDVREGVWRAVFGDFKAVLKCLWTASCAGCAHRSALPILRRISWLYAAARRRAFTETPERLVRRIKEIEAGGYNAEWTRVLSMNEKELEDRCAQLA